MFLAILFYTYKRQQSCQARNWLEMVMWSMLTSLLQYLGWWKGGVYTYWIEHFHHMITTASRYIVAFKKNTPGRVNGIGPPTGNKMWLVAGCVPPGRGPAQLSACLGACTIRTTSCVLFTRSFKTCARVYRLGHSSQTGVICESSEIAS